MYNKEQAIEQIEEFLFSNEKCMLITGTHQYEKHKLIIRILNEHLENNLILFRTNSMQNIKLEDFLGWANIEKQPQAGEQVKIGKNVYECDSLYTSSTRFKTSRKFSCAIVYPIDALHRGKKLNSIDNLFRHKEISKIFLVSWTDRRDYNYSIFSQYVERHVIYDAEEEDPAYHKRVTNIIDEVDSRKNF